MQTEETILTSTEKDIAETNNGLKKDDPQEQPPQTPSPLEEAVG